MSYLAWYLGIGAVLIPSMVIYHQLTKKDDARSISELLDSTHPERKKPWYQILLDKLGMILIVPFWPVLVYLKVKEMIAEKSELPSFDEPKFSVTQSDLVEALSVQEIERREMISDPLCAVPNLPFGHLNAAWVRFLDGRKLDDELWTFTTYWTNWGHKELRQGYVIVSGEKVGEHFLTAWKDVDEDAADDNTDKSSSQGNDNSKGRFNLPAWLRKQAD